MKKNLFTILTIILSFLVNQNYANNNNYYLSFDDLSYEILKLPLSSGDDDAEEFSSGEISLYNSDLELVNDGSKGNQTIGLRFTSVNIPKGSVIKDAYIEFACDETKDIYTSLIIQCEAVDNSVGFTQSLNNISSREKTENEIVWQPETWNTPHAIYSTSDLSPIIQEIINRDGWNAGQALTFIITGTGKRTAESYEGVAGDESLIPTLIIEYSNTDDNDIPEPEIVPTAPESLVSVAVSNTQINLSWVDNSDNEDGFVIERSEGSTSDFIKIDTVLSNVNTYEDIYLTSNTDYFYRIAAFNSNGNSEYSNTTQATTFEDLKITSPLASIGAVNEVYSYCITTTNQPTTFAAYGLPQGLSFEGQCISGTPTEAGNYKIILYAADDVYSTTDTLFLEITEKSSVIELEIPIISGSNDVEEYSDGTMSLNNSDLELVNDGTKGNQTIGLRFENIDIPQGSSIESASLKFACDEVKSIYTDLLIRCEAVGNSEAFTYSSYNVSSRLKTVKEITWQPEAWSVINKFYNTPNLADILQEVLDLEEWSEGNALTLIITGSGKRTAKSFEGAAGNNSLVPILTIKYSTTGNNVIPEPETVPNAPGTLVSTAVSNTQVNLSWVDNSDNEEGFIIERSEAAADSFIPVDTVLSNENTYEDISLLPNTEYFYKVVAYNSIGNSEYSNTTQVTTLAIQTPYGGIPWPVPGTIEAEDFDEGGEGIAYHDLTETNSNSYRDEAVDLYDFYTSDVIYVNGEYVQQYNVHWGVLQSVTEWIEYTIDVEEDGYYNFSITGYSSSCDSLHFFIDGIESFVDVREAFESQPVLTTNKIYYVPIAKGEHVLRVLKENYWYPGSTMFIDKMVIEKSTELKITSPLSSSGKVNEYYQYAITTTNDPTIYSATGLPEGLIFENSVIYGTPTEAGNFDVILYVADDKYSVTDTLHLEINEVEQETAPIAPGTLVSTAVSNTQVNLSWVDNSDNEEGFIIERSKAVADSFIPVDTVLSNENTYEDISLLPNTEYFYKVVAYNSIGNSEYSNTTQVTTLAIQTPYGGVPWPVPGTIEIEDFDEGGEGIAYHDLTETNDYIDMYDSCYRDGAVDLYLDYKITYEYYNGEYYPVYNEFWGVTPRESEWLEYTINIEEDGEYNFTIGGYKYASFDTLFFLIDDVEMFFYSPEYSDWRPSVNYSTFFYVPMTKGEHILRILNVYSGISGNNGVFVDKMIINKSAELKITSPLISSGTVNEYYQYIITTTNDPTLFSATGVPEGLIFDSRAIYGTPTEAGNFDIILSVSDDKYSVTDTLHLEIIEQASEQELELPIISGSNDVEEYADGTMSLNNSDLELVNDGTKGNQTVGLRFEDVSIPQGATILSASLEFSCEEAKSAGTYLDIYTEAEANSIPFSNTAFDVSSRSKSTEKVIWHPDEWELGNDYNTPDLSTIVQEVINYSDWEENNALTFIITGYGKRTAYSYEGAVGESSLIPKLSLTYTTSSINDKKAITTIAETSLKEEILIYPNPLTGNKLYIDLPSEILPCDINVFTIDGRLVKTISEVNTRSLDIDVSDNSQNILLINIRNQNTSLTKKIVKN